MCSKHFFLEALRHFDERSNFISKKTDSRSEFCVKQASIDGFERNFNENLGQFRCTISFTIFFNFLQSLKVSEFSSDTYNVFLVYPEKINWKKWLYKNKRHIQI